MIFIKIKVKGYLNNLTDNELFEFEEKGIKNKNKVTFSSDNIKNVIKINDNEVILVREGYDFINTFVFKNNNSSCNYLLKENNYDVDININTIMIGVSDNTVYIKYTIHDSGGEYEYKLEMSDI